MTIRKLFLLMTLFVGMSISEINAETKDSLWTTSGYAGLKLTQVSFTIGRQEGIMLLPLICKEHIKQIINIISMYGKIDWSWLMD